MVGTPQERVPRPLTMAERIAESEATAGDKAHRLGQLYPTGLSLQHSFPVTEVLLELRNPNLNQEGRLKEWQRLNSIYDQILVATESPHTPTS